MTIVFAVIPFHTNWQQFIVTGAVTGGLAGSLYPIGLSMIGGLVAHQRLGAATSLFSLAFGIGSLIGPALSGFAMDHLSNRWLFYLPSLLTAIFTAVLISLYRKTAARKAPGV